MYPEEEVPVFRTCLGAPISVGLFIWASLRTLLDITAIGFTGSPVFFILIFGYKALVSELNILHPILIGFVAMVVDVPFLITFMIGICQKNYAILRTIYYYVIYLVVLEALAVPVTIFTFYVNKTEPIIFVFLVLIGLIIIAIDTTVIFALKSKLTLMRNSEMPEFVNMTQKE